MQFKDVLHSKVKTIESEMVDEPTQSRLKSFVEYIAKNPKYINRVIMISVIAGIGLTFIPEGGNKASIYTALAEKDQATIKAELEKMNIPVEISKEGDLLVPNDKLDGIRMALAKKNLPKTNGGIPLLGEDWVEPVKKAIEATGYLGNAQIEMVSGSLGSLSKNKGVKITISVSEKDKQGVMFKEDIKGIQYLVASLAGIPNNKLVEIYDQKGELLTAKFDELGEKTPEMSVKEKMEEDLNHRVINLLNPIYGSNFKSAVTLDLDFSKVEEQKEEYTPNSGDNPYSLRSSVIIEDNRKQNNASGIPGALSFTPPSSPTVNPANQSGQIVQNIENNGKYIQSIKNYEVSKKVSSIKKPVGEVRRISAAIAINYKPILKEGKLEYVAMDKMEIEQLHQLVKSSLGFDDKRGDSLTVSNILFDSAIQKPDTKDIFMDLMIKNWKEILKYMLMFLGLNILYFGIIKPILKDMEKPSQKNNTINENMLDLNNQIKPEQNSKINIAEIKAHEDEIQKAKELVKNDPKMASVIIKEWLAEQNNQKK